MRVVGVIPSRYGSTRFPGKPLARIGGKPLLQWVIEGVKTSSKITDILVATDHNEIFELAKSLGALAVMTDSELPSGSDRVKKKKKNRDVDVVVNIQGDEPTVNGEILDLLVSCFERDEDLPMATLARPIKNKEDLESLATAKIVVDKDQNAIYFSRYPIPFSRNSKDAVSQLGLKHIGLYAYRKSFLKQFCECEPAGVEIAEGLEQLRALYLGAKIKVLKVDHESWGVDYPEDIEKVEAILRKGNS